jgi:hypothetical protein
MKIKTYLQILAVFASVIFVTATANAQATRTWVSGVGDDVNPCSRTAPCKTFAGAISKTAEGGEIDALDPAGYGTLTISKAMTVDGGTGSGWASVLNTGGIAGFNVNITTGTHVNDAVVILRNITINGASQSPSVAGTRGINITKCNRVFVYNCHIENQSTSGITQNATTSTDLYVRDSDFSNVATGINSTAAGGTLVVEADNINVQGCSSGVVLTGSGVFGLVTNSNLSRNIGGTATQAGSGCTLNLTHNHFHANTTAVNALAGSTVRVNECELFDNASGFAGNASSIQSGGNNKLAGNAASITPTGTPLTNQ